MIFEEDGKYFRQCDQCGNITEIQRQFFRKLSTRPQHWCSSCYQKGERNHQHGAHSWNYGLTKETDERVKAYGESGSRAKQGSIPWNKGETYITLKGEEWAKRFKLQVSNSKKGCAKFAKTFFYSSQ